MNNTVILSFGYKRPKHFAKSLVALAIANSTHRLPIVIHIDGCKSLAEAKMQEECVNVALKFKEEWFSVFQIQIIVRDVNLGLATSITNLLDTQLELYDCAIVIEDDVILNRLAIDYTLRMLEKYDCDPAVMSISLFNPYPNNFVSPVPFLSPRMQCWGWATWKSRWIQMPSACRSRNCLKRFYSGLKIYYSLFVGLDSFSTLHQCLYAGRDLWACKWVLAHVLANSFSIIPPVSLSKNIGLDGSGENCTMQSTSSSSSEIISNLELSMLVDAQPLRSSNCCQLFAFHFSHASLNTIIPNSDLMTLADFL